MPQNLRIVKRFQSKNSVVVWDAVSHSGKLLLKFIDKKLKIIAEYCTQEILAAHLLLHADRFYLKMNLAPEMAPLNYAELLLYMKTWVFRLYPKEK